MNISHNEQIEIRNKIIQELYKYSFNEILNIALIASSKLYDEYRGYLYKDEIDISTMMKRFSEEIIVK
jgi:hypothetical protein